MSCTGAVGVVAPGLVATGDCRESAVVFRSGAVPPQQATIADSNIAPINAPTTWCSAVSIRDFLKVRAFDIGVQ